MTHASPSVLSHDIKEPVIDWTCRMDAEPRNGCKILVGKPLYKISNMKMDVSLNMAYKANKASLKIMIPCIPY